MAPPADPPFLARRSYRRRRIMDAARLLPILGAVLWLLPVLGGGEGGSTARGGLYVFAVWILLIAAAAALSRTLRADPPPEDERRGG